MANFHASGAARTSVSCSKCGKTTTVPFVPTPGRPVFCRECFGARPPSPMSSGPTSPARSSTYAVPRSGGHGIPRKRMMAQGRKGHFMHDARAALMGSEGGMEDQHVRAFLEGLFARGARASTQAAQEFLDEKATEGLITAAQRDALGHLVDRYSFWR